MVKALDIRGNVIESGFVVEIRNAYGKSHNGLWLVDKAYDNGHLWLHKLNKNMTKAKESPSSSTSWPLHSYMNNPWKRREINSYNEVHAVIEVLCVYKEPKKKPVSDKLRLTKRGIYKGEDYCSCHYWLNNDGSITIYARHYNQHIPREVGEIRNESDSMTDYFETDSCTLYPGDTHYEEALRCCSK